MNHDDHNIWIGRLVGNLGSLEFVLRLFLAEGAGQKVVLPTPDDKQVPTTFVTNWDSLSDLIGKYNAKLTSIEARTFRVDHDASKVRDSLAHGRLMSATPEPPFTLFRFGKPDGDTVRVERVETVDAAWLRRNVDFTHGQILRVVRCAQARGYASFPTD